MSRRTFSATGSIKIMSDSERSEKPNQVEMAFADLKHDDALFLKLKQLLMYGKRAEAIKLIQTSMNFETPEAQELTSLIMNTLSDTQIDP